MPSHSTASAGTVEETIDPSRSSKATPWRPSMPASLAASSSQVSARSVAKRQCWTSSSPRKVPKWVWVLPTSTTRSIRIGDHPSMALTLYAVPASHPSAAAERALQLKGLPYRRVDLPAVAHAAVQRVRFGSRALPAPRGGGGSGVGSRPVLRGLGGPAPHPPPP